MPQSADNSSTEKCRSNVVSSVVMLRCLTRDVTTLMPKATNRIRIGTVEQRIGSTSWLGALLFENSRGIKDVGNDVRPSIGK